MHSRGIMTNTRNAALASAIAGLLFGVLAAAGPLAPVKNAWSNPVSNLSGRLRVAKSAITTDEYFELALELSNSGNIPLAVQCHNPHIFRVTVFDAAGKQVKTIFTRSDILSSPHWGIIPRGGYLGFRVSIQSQDGAKGSHLDITTLIWKLSPGTYRISGEFSSGRAEDFMGGPGKATIWEGKIDLPPVDIEITEKE
jgi:hypothetical protein